MSLHLTWTKAKNDAVYIHLLLQTIMWRVWIQNTLHWQMRLRLIIVITCHTGIAFSLPHHHSLPNRPGLDTPATTKALTVWIMESRMSWIFKFNDREEPISTLPMNGRHNTPGLLNGRQTPGLSRRDGHLVLVVRDCRQEGAGNIDTQTSVLVSCVSWSRTLNTVTNKSCSVSSISQGQRMQPQTMSGLEKGNISIRRRWRWRQDVVFGSLT